MTISTVAARRINILAFGLCACLVSIIVAGLWPFTFSPPNQVEWVYPAGVRYTGRGVIYSPRPLLIPGPLSPNSALTIELVVHATSESTQGIAHLLSFYDKAGTTFFVGQWRSHLIIRSRITQNNLAKKPYKTIEGFREIGVHEVFPSGQRSIVTITSDLDGTTVYVNGAMWKHYPDFALLHDTRDSGERIVIGNSPVGTQQWDGVISGLAIYDRPLGATEVSELADAWSQRRPYLHTQTVNPLCLYLFNEGTGEVIHDHTGQGNDLVMPATFVLLQKTFLSLPKTADRAWWSFAPDVLINIAGFVPFGVFLSSFLSLATGWNWRPVALITLISGICLSLAIEIIQAYIPGRDSSFTDLVMNTVGTAAGIALLKAVASYRLNVASRSKAGAN